MTNHGAGDSPRPIPPRLDPRGGRPGRPGPAVAPARDERRAVAPGSRRKRLALGARLVAGALSLVLVSGSGWGWYLGRVAEAAVNRTDAIPATGTRTPPVPARP